MGRLKSWILPAVALLGTGILGAVRDTRYSGDIAWARDYRSGLQLARQTHQPLLLSFNAPDCGWCSKMSADTFTDAHVVALSHRYVCVRLDSDIDSDIVAQYRVSSYPTTLIADSAGRSLFRLSGYILPDRFARILRSTLRGAK